MPFEAKLLCKSFESRSRWFLMSLVSITSIKISVEVWSATMLVMVALDHNDGIFYCDDDDDGVIMMMMRRLW